MVGGVDDRLQADVLVHRHQFAFASDRSGRAARRPIGSGCPTRPADGSPAADPTVEIVIRRWPIPRPVGLVASPSAAQQIRQIGQRLAHAHHDDVAQPFVRRQQAGESKHLLDDFAGREIADDAVQPAGAKHAAHRAADLRADADRPPRAVAEQHAFDPIAVVQFEQQLLRAVGGAVMLGDFSSPNGEIRGECRAQFLRQIGHVVEGVGAALEEPTSDLPRAIRRAGRVP